MSRTTRQKMFNPRKLVCRAASVAPHRKPPKVGSYELTLYLICEFLKSRTRPSQWPGSTQRLSVPPRRVRFRMLNGSASAIYRLYLYPETSSNSGEAKVGIGLTMYQIGTEGGFLPAVAVDNNTTAPPVVGNYRATFNPDGPFNLLAPGGERGARRPLIHFNGRHRGADVCPL